MSAFSTPSGLVFTSHEVLYEGWPILTVTHDADDRHWRFVNGWGDTEEGATPILVHVEHLIDLDSTLLPLADLPLGWRAWRQTPDDEWKRESIPPDVE